MVIPRTVRPSTRSLKKALLKKKKIESKSSQKRLPAPKQRRHRDMIDPQERFAAATEVLRQVIQSPEVSKQFDPDLPPLSVDAILLGQVFQNIVHNAIQAMPNGGHLFLFSGFYLQKPGYAFISINDSGPGIPRSEAEKVFHPFYTTKDHGTGLGLSLAHRIVEAHNGMMWVCHHPCHHFVTKPVDPIIDTPKLLGRGATIHILLPV